MKTAEKRTRLNPKHKAVYLNKKNSGDELFFYCINKGKEIKREIIQKDSQTYLHLVFEINGYYSFIDFLVPEINKPTALYWSHEILEKYIYGDFRAIKAWGLSVENKF